jgi:carbamate kinase
MTKTAVVALGGNALTRVGQSGTCDEMLANAVAMASAVHAVIEAGWRVVIDFESVAECQHARR